METHTLDFDELKSEMRTFHNLPSQLTDYIRIALKCGFTNDPLIKLLSTGDRLSLLSKLDGRFARACVLTRLSPDNFVSATGFVASDTGQGRIESFLAHLRALAMLHDEGATRIELLPPGQAQESDFLAGFGERTCCAVEVFHRAQYHHLDIGHTQRCYNLEHFFVRVARKKKSQIDATANRHHCQLSLLLGVIDSQQLVIYRTRTDLHEALERISTELMWGTGYHFGILTGRVSWEGEDDCIYPPLPRKS
jgi:hypothetical protein